jgi:uncharacterized membrane protein (UPF0182 family)
MQDEMPRANRLNRGPMLAWLIIGVIALVVALFVAWTYLEWSIYQHVYSLKAGLNWFQIVFYHDYTFIAAALFSLLLINPVVGHSDFWRLVSTFLRGSLMVRRPREYEGEAPTYEPMRLPKPGKWLWFLWQVIKWSAGFVYFVLAGGLIYLGNVMNPIMMMTMGLGDWSKVFRVFSLPLFPASGTELVSLMPTMEIQYRVVYIVILSLLAIVAIRTLLRLLANLGIRTSDVWLRNFMVFLIAIFLSFIMGAPYWSMNVSTPYVYGALWTILAGAVLGWGYLRVTGKKVFESPSSRRTIFKGLAVVVSIGLVIQLGALVFFYANWNNNYLSYEWNPQIQKEITVTRWAAGVGNIQPGSLLNLPTSNATTTLALVRQWDQQAAAVTMTKEIGAYNWMTLASSEIVFLNNKEYWVAPTSTLYPSTDWISEHLIYTHTSQVMVINTYSGQEVPVEQSFNVSSEPPIYYGEEPLNGEPGGFSQNVYIHVPGYDEIQNSSYQGQPDYVLTGWQKALWFTFAEGQLGFAFSSQYQSIDMLFNRDVFSRVQSILIPGLVEDPAAYLSTDGSNLYYTVQLYIDYPMQSGFAVSPYLRFFGVVLVNVADGSMQGYTVSNLVGTNSSDFLTTFYQKYYPTWGPPPSWLVPQLRYPEALLGSSETGPGQLDYDFLFHVNDPFVWRSGTQFYERPANTSVQYIPWAIGNETYFVGMQLVNFENSASENLAAMYIAYGGTRLGQIEVYQNPSPSTTFIGPTAAEQALQTNGQVRTQLTLLPNYRIGSYLLYSIGGQLTYFVAVYTNPGTSGVVTQLPFITAISPVTGNVSLGAAADTAYYNLAGAVSTPTVSNILVLLSNVASLITTDGYSLVNATSLNPTVLINRGTFSFSLLGLNATFDQVSNFLSTYGPGNLGNAVYMWNDTVQDYNIGVLKSGGAGVTQLYYVTIAP